MTKSYELAILVKNKEGYTHYFRNIVYNRSVYADMIEILDELDIDYIVTTIESHLTVSKRIRK